MAVDRYVCVLHPRKYQRHSSKKVSESHRDWIIRKCDRNSELRRYGWCLKLRSVGRSVCLSVDGTGTSFRSISLPHFSFRQHRYGIRRVRISDSGVSSDEYSLESICSNQWRMKDYLITMPFCLFAILCRPRPTFKPIQCRIRQKVAVVMVRYLVGYLAPSIVHEYLKFLQSVTFEW